MAEIVVSSSSDKDDREIDKYIDKSISSEGSSSSESSSKSSSLDDVYLPSVPRVPLEDLLKEMKKRAISGSSTSPSTAPLASIPPPV